jgi:hypothetical protein
MSKQKVHAVVGNGEASEKAIRAALSDALNDGDAIGLVWSPPHGEGTEAVFDYVLDKHVPFVMYYKEGANPHKLFRQSEHGIVQKVRNPLTAALRAIDGGNVLFLWDDEENPEDDETLISHVFDVAGEDALVLALNHGLAPISLEPDVEIPEIEEDAIISEEEEDDDPVADFTIEELENMPASSVKTWAAKRGIPGTTKAAILDGLREARLDEVGVDLEEEEEEDSYGVTDPQRGPGVEETALPPAPNVGSSPAEDGELAKALRAAASHLIKAANLLGA